MATFHPHLLIFVFLLVRASDAASSNPYTAKAALLRYWTRKTPKSPPIHRPDFIVSKLSPLSAMDYATYSSLAATDPIGLSARLTSFCAAAHLLCNPSLTPSLESHSTDSHFTTYTNTNFTNYGAGHAGNDSFKKYSENTGGSLITDDPIDSFSTYAKNSVAHDTKFKTYSPGGNVNTDDFTSYGSSATGGDSGFTNYARDTNVPTLKFSNYATNTNSHQPAFTNYANHSNSGGETFAGYGREANFVGSAFTAYANNTNVIASGFSSYSQKSVGTGDTFASYGDNSNLPENNFTSYGSNAINNVESFTSYRRDFRDHSTISEDPETGTDSFKSYATDGLTSTVGFTAYGPIYKTVSDSFKGYGKGATNLNVTFKSYTTDNVTFKEYAKSGVHFKSYNKSSLADAGNAVTKPKWAVEPGKFFRESSLKKGTVMPMPDIRDKMPPRSFLPRSISSHFSSSINSVLRVFNLSPDTAMGKAVVDTMSECRRAPSKGETKRCAMSAEDVIDFAVSILGDGAVVWSTGSARGFGENVVVGEVRGVDGGRLTKSVSCHQSLFPYLVYYCHSVPKVRLYEAEILAVDSKEKINRGIAICHTDTSDWSAGHGAFVALGSSPGKIEVCHWIFQGDMTWTS